jgi:NhaP-type Na+/H+ or K+/H+ antiporter
MYSVIWKVFQPVLFGLIGTEIDLSQLEANTVLYGLCVLAVGLMVSMFTMLGCSLFQGRLFLKILMFVCLQNCSTVTNMNMK